MLNTQVVIPEDVIGNYCESQPIQKLSVFGSVLREDFNTESDLDLLVEFQPGAGVTYFDLFEMQEALSAIIGHPVDLRTPQELSPYFRQSVIDHAVMIYER